MKSAEMKNAEIKTPARKHAQMRKALPAVIAVVVAACSASVAAQWPSYPSSGVPRDAEGKVRMDAPSPRTADGHPDFSGVWMRANSGPPGRGRGGQREGGRGTEGAQAGRGADAAPAAPGADAAPAGRGAAGRGAAAAGNGGGGIEPATAPFPFDPSGPPVAAFFEAGQNIEGGLPYTPWATAIKKERTDLKAKDNPDANCMPMGFLQFHQQPQPRKIIQTPQLILIEYEANYGLRHIYIDGRKLPPQGEPQPWWYGYSVGHWEGDTLVVETNNLRGAEDTVYDGWLDVNGSPYSQQAKFTERIRRPTFGHLQIDTTLEDPKAYTKPWTVRVDQRILPDQEMIEFVCNENQQFRRRVKID
jgi:hypothetical protein